jgi:hypothetical protein
MQYKNFKYCLSESKFKLIRTYEGPLNVSFPNAKILIVREEDKYSRNLISENEVIELIEKVLPNVLNDIITQKLSSKKGQFIIEDPSRGIFINCKGKIQDKDATIKILNVSTKIDFYTNSELTVFYRL